VEESISVVVGHMPPNAYMDRCISFESIDVEKENAEARKFALVWEVVEEDVEKSIDACTHDPFPGAVLLSGVNIQNEALLAQDPV
jgi:hypothetical protein